MPVFRLLQWQWAGYSRYHQSRTNLLLHVAVVPLFLAGNVFLVVALARSWWLGAAISLGAMALSIALQGRGHSQEAVPPEAFTSPVNAITRIFLEQWVIFPGFVLSGSWWRAWRGAAA